MSSVGLVLPESLSAVLSTLGVLEGHMVVTGRKAVGHDISAQLLMSGATHSWKCQHYAKHDVRSEANTVATTVIPCTCTALLDLQWWPPP